MKLLFKFIYDYFMGRYVLEGARERFTWTDKQYEKENDGLVVYLGKKMSIIMIYISRAFLGHL